MKPFKELFNFKEMSIKKKAENLVCLLIMLVLIVIGINVIWNGDNEGEKVLNIENDVSKVVTKNAEYSLEKKLEEILNKVDGVNNANVLITYVNNELIVPMYNVENSETTTNEIDTSGGSRNIIEKSFSQEIVTEENGSKKTVIVANQVNPEISGIIVVASFTDNSIKQEIVSAVSTIARISEYKVKVLKGG